VRRLPLASILSGLALAAAEPGFGWSHVAWLALVPLAWAIDGERLAKAFALGWIAGCTFFLVELRWIPGTMLRASSVAKPLAAAAPVLLAAVLAIYFGVFAASLRFWQSRSGRSGVVAAAVLWTSLEWMRSNAFLPCPWALVGYAIGDSRPLAQIMDLTGPFGASALVVAVNQAVYAAVFHRGKRSAAALVVVFAAVVGAATYGELRLAELASRPVEETLRIGMVQPAIDPNRKWDPAARGEVLDVSETLSREAVANGATFVVWPEASVPYVFAEDALYERDPERFAADRRDRDRTAAFVRELGVPLLIGSAVVVPTPAGRGELWNSVNRSLLLLPDGAVAAAYDKTILVPFGEYVPWPQLLFFVDKLVPGIGNFVPGDGPTYFGLGDARFAVLVCYEAIFADYARRMVDGGAAFLVNQTNDGWFGDSAAPIEHLAAARLRAVENHVPLVRVANTGISALVGPDGGVTAKLPLGQRGVTIVDVPLSRRSPTFYTLHGDVFAKASTLAAAALLLYAAWKTDEPEPAAVPA
jgi:apolipoprotein N-acyltransferase